MFIKQLKISTPTKLIRELNFTKGVNLIVDNTSLKDDKTTGNNIGKTTILKLINYCLGGKAEQIYKDQENRKNKEQQLEQVLEIENKLNQVRQKVEEFEKTFYYDEIKNQIDSQMKQFNDIFYGITSNFYNDGFVLEFDKKKDKKQNIDFYEFQMNQTSNSSGKKQGEIVCFDISYIIYADQKILNVLDFY
ncbi:hypothetical protein MZO39_03300 [Mycoplasma capricolum subsp. capricolum]|uniref:hypothetical protein n=1 Tax=Mycoplasma capricolum TaxID=2095 RepID=UPI0020BDD2DC|nr:hypothetical protein [Mycoplasma capricolum]MCK8462039.1 hypothetical protein [Mycoplasma capricolum subsp. capricolum]